MQISPTTRARVATLEPTQLEALRTGKPNQAQATAIAKTLGLTPAQLFKDIGEWSKLAKTELYERQLNFKPYVAPHVSTRSSAADLFGGAMTEKPLPAILAGDALGAGHPFGGKGMQPLSDADAARLEEAFRALDKETKGKKGELTAKQADKILDAAGASKPRTA